MSFIKSPSCRLSLPAITALVCGTAGMAGAAVLVQDGFNNGDFASAGPGNTGSGFAVYNNDSKSAAETTTARWVAGTTAGGWQRTELHSNDEIPVALLLTSNAYVQYSWTLGNVSTVRRDTGTDAEYRIQLGILPDTVTQGNGAEMYVNTQGGIWFDMNILGTNSSSASVTLYDANLTKAANTDGTARGGAQTVAGWDWASTSRTFSLTLTSTGYSWSDSAGNSYGGATYAEAGFTQAMFMSSYWGFIMGQDRAEIGRGGHDLTNFSVAAVPEAGTTALAGLAAAGLLRRRRPRTPGGRLWG